MGKWKCMPNQVAKPDLVRDVAQHITVFYNVKAGLYLELLHPKHVHANDESNRVWIELVGIKSKMSKDFVKKGMNKKPTHDLKSSGMSPPSELVAHNSLKVNTLVTDRSFVVLSNNLSQNQKRLTLYALVIFI